MAEVSTNGTPNSTAKGRKWEKDMKKSIKRLLCLLLAFVFVASGLVVPLSAYSSSMPGADIGSNGGNLTADTSGKTALNASAGKQYKSDDEITVIVRLKGDSLMDAAEAAGKDASDFVLTDAGKRFVAEAEKRIDKVIAAFDDEILSVKYHYTTLFQGFSCKIKYKDLTKLEKASAVRTVMISEQYNPAETATDNALNAYGTGIYNSSGTGLTGKGIVVAVLDTGLDYTHSAFQRLPDCAPALTADQVEELFPMLAASSLNEEGRWQSTYHSTKVPYTFDYADKDSDVYPVNDHGTHVAGIIAGKDDVITGVAIDAQLVIMKVFGNEDQGAEQEDILAGLSDSVLLGVDVINMSLGSSCGFSRAADDEGINEIYDSVRDAGINLIVAASNSSSSAKGSENGDTNLVSNPDSATIGSPATYPSSVSVASVTGAKTHYLYANGEQPIYLVKAKRNNGDEIEFYDLMLNGKKTAELEYVLVPGIGNDGNYETVDVKGKIAVVKRGVTTFEEKVDTAKNHGAIGVIIYNNVSGTISMTIGVSTMPACSVSMDSGKYFEAHPTGKLVLDAENLAGPFMSDFSSWGPNSDLELSPDVTSYGGDINSAVRGGYDILSGTSMACPNLAGSAALVRESVKEKFPNLTAKETMTMVNRLLMSTASILRNEAGNPYSPRKQGAGLADAERAIKTPAYLLVEGSDKTKLSLGDDPNKTGEYRLVFHLVNTSAATLSYALNVITMTEGVSSDGKTVAEQAYLLSPSVSYEVSNGTLRGNMVTVSGYGDATVTVTVKLSDADREYLDAKFKNGMYVEGFVTLAAQDCDTDLTIPYLGFWGDWTKAPMLDVTEFEVGKEQKDSSILEDEKLKPDVFATIPMVGYYNGTGRTEDDFGYYYMGRVGFILADGYEQPATLEKYCSLTSSKDGNFKLYYIAAGLLRNAKTVKMKITDSVTGEVVFEKETQNCRKSYYNGQQTGGYVMVDFDASEAGLANNTKYDFTMTCSLDWDGEQHNDNDTFSFSFYMDDEAPVIREDLNTLRVKTDKSGNVTDYLLDMYIYDNQYVQGYFLYTYDYLDENGNPVNAEPVIKGMIPVDDFEGGKVNKITQDLTDIWYRLKDGEEAGSKNIGIQVYDYAKHSTSLYYTLKKTDAGTVAFKSGRNSTADGKVISFTMAPYTQKNLFENLETTPKDVYTAPLTWTSSDESVAIVKDGIVTTLKAGTATITAVSKTGASASVEISCKGTASSSTIPLSGLQLNESSVTLERGETLELYVEMFPYNMTETPEIEWKTASSYVTLTVDPNNPLHCTVYAKESGSANVTASAKGKLFSATCRVRVKEEFTIESIYLKSYTGRGDENGVVEIPAEKGITTIYRLAFANNKYITKVIIPEGVEEIQYAAFYGCENLKEIVLPSTMKQIDEWGFGQNKALETVNLEKVQTIQRLAFYGCTSLKTVNLENCHTICEYAFGFCESIESLDLTGVGQLGEYSFVGCSGIRDLKVGERIYIPEYCFANCSSIQELELSVQFVGRLAFLGCSRITTLRFTSDVTEIGYGAFNGCSSLVNLIFDGSLQYLGDYAFAGCGSLPSVFIPAGCEYLGKFAFGSCSSLEAVTFSADAVVREIGEGVFYGDYDVTAFTVEPGSKYLSVSNGVLYTRDMSRLILMPAGKVASSFTVPASVREIGDYAFSYKGGVYNVYLPSVRKIGKNAFMNCTVRSVSSIGNLTEIGDNAFYNCPYLMVFELPEGLETIGANAFYGCTAIAWSDFTLPASVKTVGEYAFCGNYGITSVTLPAQLTTVPDGMFAQCKNLTKVTLHDKVTEIGGYAFRKCEALEEITLPASVVTLGEACFAETGLKTIALPSALAEIPAYCFYGDRALTEISIPASVTSVGNFAFYQTTALKNLDLANVRELGSYALIGSAVETLRADRLEKVGDYAFFGTSIASLTLPELTEIGDYGFANMEKLTAFSAEKTETIGVAAFYRTAGLKSLNLPACTDIGDYAFMLASSLEQINLAKLERLGTYAFYATRLTKVSLPATVESIAPGAFITKAFNSTDDNILRIAEITVDAACKNYFTDDHGAVYRRLENGMYELVAYPSGSKETSYTILEGTVRIAEEAFSTGVSLKEITVARTVTNIGAAAFYGCSALEKINFLSVEAPVLESRYYENSADGWTYNNFVDFIPGQGENRINLTVTVPKNAVRYDSYTWDRYLGAATKTDRISMTNSTELLIRMIDELPETITLADVEQVEYLNRLYNAMDSEQIPFVTNSDKLKAAVKVAEQLRRDNPTEDPGKTDPEPSDPGNSSDTGDTTETAAPSDTTGGDGTGDTGSGEQTNAGCSSRFSLDQLAVVLLAVAVSFVLKKKKGGNADA